MSSKSLIFSPFHIFLIGILFSQLTVSSPLKLCVLGRSYDETSTGPQDKASLQTSWWWWWCWSSLPFYDVLLWLDSYLLKNTLNVSCSHHQAWPSLFLGFDYFFFVKAMLLCTDNNIFASSDYKKRPSRVLCRSLREPGSSLVCCYGVQQHTVSAWCLFWDVATALAHILLKACDSGAAW